jgi:rubrerythrin
MQKKTREKLFTEIKEIADKLAVNKLICRQCDASVSSSVAYVFEDQFVATCGICSYHGVLTIRPYVTLTPYDLALIITHELSDRGYTVKRKPTEDQCPKCYSTNLSHANANLYCRKCGYSESRKVIR